MSTKRERLLDWIRYGDCQDVPVLMGPHNFEVASAMLGKDQRDVTWSEAIEVARQTGTHLLACVGMPMLFEAITFMDDIELKVKQEILSDGTPRTTKCITTPHGNLVAIIEAPKDKGEYHREFYVKGPQDLPAFAYLIRNATQAIVKNLAIREKVNKDISVVISQIDGQLPLMLWPFIPAVELTSCFYMDQMTAVYLIYDQPAIFEELMDRHWEMTRIWLELGNDLNIDIYGHAINGYEWLNPDLYDKYMIPQAARLTKVVAEQGKISWLHTCGKIKEIAASGAYTKMGINVFESLSMPPTGNIDDFRATRTQIGSNIVTRGGVNCEILYDNDIDQVRHRTEHVLESTKGYKHMIGDTNASYPSYPWNNIKGIIDVVRASGRLYE